MTDLFNLVLEARWKSLNFKFGNSPSNFQSLLAHKICDTSLYLLWEKYFDLKTQVGIELKFQKFGLKMEAVGTFFFLFIFSKFNKTPGQTFPIVHKCSTEPHYYP